MLICVHRRSSAANKGFENSRTITQHIYWPPMNADERRCPDSLTEQVIAAIFEVANTLGAGFLEKVYERALLKELTLRGIRATSQASLRDVQRPLRRRILCRYPRRKHAGTGAQMCRPPNQRTHRSMPQLSKGLRPNRLSINQFPELQGRLEAHRQWL